MVVDSNRRIVFPFTPEKNECLYSVKIVSVRPSKYLPLLNNSPGEINNTRDM